MATRKIRAAWWVDFRWDRTRYRKRSPVNTRAGAVQYEQQLRERLAKGEPLELPHSLASRSGAEDSLTYAQFAREWFTTYVTTNNKPSEQRSKATILRAHLVPAFGELKLSEITTPCIEQFKARQLSSKTRGKKTVNNQLAVLSKSLRCAALWGLLEKVPNVQLLRVGVQPFRFLSPEECHRLLACDVDSQWNLMVRVALRTGMRRGELRALHWSDIDFKRNRISVSKSVSGSVITESKTYQTRAIPLAADIAERLRARVRSQGLVFPNDHDGVLTEWQVEDAIRRLAAQARLQKCRWHTLRHTFGTLLAMSGVSLHVIRELLGHSTLAMTLRYVHVVPSALDDAIHRLEASTNNSYGVPESGQPVGNIPRNEQRTALTRIFVAA